MAVIYASKRWLYRTGGITKTFWV